MAPSVVYLGHKVDSEGWHPNLDTVKAIVEAHRSHSMQKLMSGMTNSFLILLGEPLANGYYKWHPEKRKNYMYTKQTQENEHIKWCCK